MQGKSSSAAACLVHIHIQVGAGEESPKQQQDIQGGLSEQLIHQYRNEGQFQVTYFNKNVLSKGGRWC